MPDPNYHALLVGNGLYERDPGKLPRLEGPRHDVRIVREALTHPRFGLFDPANIREVLDASSGEVLESIEMFFSGRGRQDVLLLYFSGHGLPDNNANLYLCARNTHPNLLTSSAISDDAINAMARNSYAGKFIFILDCCHSGGFKGGADGRKLVTIPDDEASRPERSGRCLITSCASHELSHDAAAPGQASAFTHFLAEALATGEVDADGDGVVLMSEVFKYVEPRVYTARHQTVQYAPDRNFGEVAIARAEPRRARREPEPPPPGPDEPRPVLKVSEERIETREVQPGEALPLERIDVFNDGDGTLDWEFECPEPWIGVERTGDTLWVRLDTSLPGTRRGNIFVRDRGRGGARTVRVLLQVVAPEIPRLVVSPARLDFGSGPRAQAPRLEARVTNAGPGRLQWTLAEAPPQLVVERTDTGFTAELAPGFLGACTGTVRLESNGGAVEIPVQATVLPPIPDQSGARGPHGGNGGGQGGESRRDHGPDDPFTHPFVTALLGWWMNEAGALLIKVENGTIVYSDHNLVGVKLGQGMIQIQIPFAILHGHNAFAGNYSAQMTIQGPMLSGTLQNAYGQVMPLRFMRQQPWFAAFVQ